MYNRIQRTTLFSIIFIVMLSGISPPAGGQEFPTKPITLVVPKSAGGVQDLSARAVTSASMAIMGQPFIILLKPGGGGAIASDVVAKAKPDGYTLLYGDPGGNSSLPAIKGRSKGPHELAAVCQLGVNISIMIARANAPYKTFKELVAYAKANPGVVKYASPGALSTREIEWKQIMEEMGINTKVIPYDGGAPSLAAVLGGHVDITTVAASTGGAHINARSVIPLYIISEKREAGFPDIPTLREVGIKRYNKFWRTVLAPKATPRPIILKLASDFKKMLEDKSVKKMLTKLHAEPIYVGPDEFTKYWLAEYEMYKKFK